MSDGLFDLIYDICAFIWAVHHFFYTFLSMNYIFWEFDHLFIENTTWSIANHIQVISYIEHKLAHLFRLSSILFTSWTNRPSFVIFPFLKAWITIYCCLAWFTNNWIICKVKTYATVKVLVDWTIFVMLFAYFYIVYKFY